MTEEQEKKQKPKATLIKHKKQEPQAEKNLQEKCEKKKVVVVKKKSSSKKFSPKIVAKQDPSKISETSIEQNKQDQDSKHDKDTIIRRSANGKPEAVHLDAGRQKTQVQQKDSVKTEVQGKIRQDYSKQDHAELSKSNIESEAIEKKKTPSDVSEPAKNKQNIRDNTLKSSHDYGRTQRPSSQKYQKPTQPQRSSRSGPDNRPRQDYGERPSPNFRSGSKPGFHSRPPAGRSPDQRQSNKGARPTRPGQKPGPKSGGFPKPSAEPVEETAKKTSSKKFFKTKKKVDYTKNKKEAIQEKDFQIKKKPTHRANPIPKEIDITEVITVSELARKMNLKASDLIAKLMSMGMMVTINQQIDAETAEILAAEYDCKVNIVSLYDETIIETVDDKESDLIPRPPIVTVMGHVDHGKTKLLDAIRVSNVAEGEHGGITQHIGAYKVAVDDGEIVFLDTPGHEAFTLMRARGAQITDIVILVVAANDGVMPQTVEAINHAKEAKVPILVAINKVDLPDANIDRVKQQLSEYDLLPEAWGGSTLFCEVSALKREGIKELLESILLQAEMLELNANYNCRAEGKVIESKVDHGRGIVSTVIVERGTLKIGDAFVAGVYPGKVRALFNDKGDKIETATPATPVEILGFTGVPDAGSPFQVTDTERKARQVGAKRQELEKQGEAKNVKKITLDNLYDSIQEGSIQELKVIIKGDVHGSVEALQTALEKLSTKEIKLTVIHATAGAIIENDVTLASASNAIIVGFHVRPTPKALALAEVEKVEIRKYNIIYDAVADIRSAMEGLLKPDLSEETLGIIEVRDTFKVPKIGLIAGCYVKEGKVRRGSSVHVIRDDIVIHTGKISSLKRFKEDTKEVESGYECGIGVANYLDIKVGDQLEAFVIKEVAKKL